MRKNKYQSDHTTTPKIFELIKGFKNEEAIQYLRENPSEINLKGWMDHTPLHKAAECGNMELVNYLITNGAKINAERSGVYATPLCWAHNLEVAKTLLDNGATMNDRELDMATRQNRIEVIDLLLKNGAKLVINEPQFLNCNSVEALNVYIKHNANLNLTDKNSSSILHRAAWNNNIKVFEHAFKNGVKWSKDSSKRNPYVLAKGGGRKEIVTYLENNLSEQISNPIRNLNISECTDQLIHIENSTITEVAFIGLTDNGKLISFIIEKDKIKIRRAIHIDLPTIRNFTINERNEIVLPTGGTKIYIIDQDELVVLRNEEINSREFDQLTFCKKKRLYIGSSKNWKITTANSEFQEINHESSEDGTLKPIVNAAETQLLFWSYDQESFFDLYNIGDDNKLHFRHTYFKDWNNSSAAACFIGNKIVVVFPKVIELYSYDSKTFSLIDSFTIKKNSKNFIKYRLSAINDQTIALAANNEIMTFQVNNKLKHLNTINTKMKDEIVLLHNTSAEDRVIACSESEIKVIDLNGKTGHNKWYHFIG